jgi:hypothetical protein
LAKKESYSIVTKNTSTSKTKCKSFNLTCELNGWDVKVSENVRQALRAIDGAPKDGAMGDEHTSRELSDLRKTRDLYPAQWWRDGCAVGSVAECLPCIQERFYAGADGIRVSRYFARPRRAVAQGMEKRATGNVRSQTGESGIVMVWLSINTKLHPTASSTGCVQRSSATTRISTCQTNSRTAGSEWRSQSLLGTIQGQLS